MQAEPLPAAEAALTRRFLQDFPHEAARLLEAMAAPEAANTLALQPSHVALPAFEALAPDVALAVLDRLPLPLASHLLAEAEPVVSVAVLAQLDADERETWLQRLDSDVAAELRGLLGYAEDCAGRMMDPRVSPLRTGMTVAEAIERLRQIRRSGLRELFVVDDEGRLVGRVEVHDLAHAAPELPLADISRDVVAAVGDLDPREDVVEALQVHPITALPVVNFAGRFVGTIRQAELMAAVEEEAWASHRPRARRLIAGVVPRAHQPGRIAADPAGMRFSGRWTGPLEAPGAPHGGALRRGLAPIGCA